MANEHATHGPRRQASMALLTDLYQLTMAHGYWKLGRAEHEAVFHLFFRKNPFKGGYTIAAGLEQAIEYLENLRFDASDLEYLGGLRGNDDKPLFEPGFLDYLGQMRLSCDIDGIPEGSVVFPHEPLLRVRGPILQGQIIETPLLNMINFSTLIATKAARICAAARGEPVLEFGLRRAQGVDGALSAARAAYVGGCAATSNCLAGKLYNIPVKGTHAHSWVMSFDDERESFAAYARALPNNCVFLVDTYDTLEGVKKAIEIGRWLRARGHEMVGIRLDSGDLAALSIGARALLDDAGFPNASIVASNDLDEHRIAALKDAGATIGVWGVGTRLATAYDQPALGGVYKLAAIRDGAAGTELPWKYRVKLSEQAIKVSNPGPQQVRRFSRDGAPVGDLIYDVERGPGSGGQQLGADSGSAGALEFGGCAHEDLLVPLFRQGARVYDPPPLADVRARASAQLAAFAPGVREHGAPARYPVGLEHRLQQQKDELIANARGGSAGDAEPASS